jgi:hypothetical protein
MNGWLDVYVHIFLTSALDGREWAASRPGHIIVREIALGTHSIGGWVGPTTGLDTTKKIKIYCPCRESIPSFSDWAKLWPILKHELNIFKISYRKKCNTVFIQKSHLALVHCVFAVLADLLFLSRWHTVLQHFRMLLILNDGELQLFILLRQNEYELLPSLPPASGMHMTSFWSVPGAMRLQIGGGRVAYWYLASRLYKSASDTCKSLNISISFYFLKVVT